MNRHLGSAICLLALPFFITGCTGESDDRPSGNVIPEFKPKPGEMPTEVEASRVRDIASSCDLSPYSEIPRRIHLIELTDYRLFYGTLGNPDAAALDVVRQDFDCLLKNAGAPPGWSDYFIDPKPYPGTDDFFMPLSGDFDGVSVTITVYGGGPQSDFPGANSTAEFKNLPNEDE